MKVFILPYKSGSAGAKTLAEALKVKRIRTNNSRFMPGSDKLVINWGNSNAGIQNQIWLNDPQAVKQASHKRYALKAIAHHDEHIPTVEFTTDYSRAYQWIEAGSIVVARTKMTGHSGEGIVICETTQQLTTVTQEEGVGLYTKYFNAKDEYRVHVMDGKVIDVQQKRKRAEVDNADVNYKVRSHANGFNYCREDVSLPECCAKAAIDSVFALRLDFGAVDLRYNAKTKQCAVMEVNTAPGLEGTTIEVYKNAFMELFSNFVVED